MPPKQLTDHEVPMSLPESQLERLETTVPIDVNDPEAVVGKSPTQLAIGRFRRDKLSMIAFVVVSTYVIGAVLAPLLVKLGVIDPLSQHQNLLDPALGSVPKGSWGGMSWSHPLGVVPGTGTDVMSRLWYGITFSLSIALAASLLAIIIGTVLGIIGGFTGGFVDSLVGRVVDLTLSFPQTLMLLALSATGVAIAAKYLP